MQGELIAALLDLLIRDASAGQRSWDDLMRALLAQQAGERALTGKDIESRVKEVCRCDVSPVFDSYVSGTAPIDFNRYLKLAGLKTDVDWMKARPDGTPLNDAGDISAWTAPGETVVRLQLLNADNA